MKRKKQLYKILAAFVFFAAAYLFSSAGIWRPLLFSASFLTAGLPVIRKAVRNIGHGQVFDENFLMSIATVGAFALGEYSEGAAVMLFYQVGELFQSYAVDKSRRSIAALMDIRPDYATVDRDGKLEKVSPEEVVPGDIIIVRAGEKIPLDGIVTDGNALLDTAALTGEPVPREVAPGDEVVSGCININGRLSIRVTKSFGESTVARILDLVENASSKKANMENFITKFARYYTPAVVLAAAAIAVLPPLLAEGAAFQEWIYRALTFLVVSCPCALVISIPLGFFGGIGAASRNGILVKGGNYLEALASAEIVVFDKTGTLTKGRFDVAEVHPEYIDEKKLLELAAYAGSSSGHPVSLSIRKAFARPIEQKRVSEVTELPGYGVRAIVDGSEIYLGNARLMAEQGIVFEPADKPGTIVYLAENGVYQGYIRICDEIRADAAAAVSRLKEGGIKRTVMLTGDNRNTGAEVARALKLDGFFAELLPEQKVAKMEELLKEKTPSGKLVFAGDGINDAPVLALSDIGIAMGGIGSDAAVEAADIVIMTDEPSKITQAIRISKTTLCIVKENIIFALGVKFLVLGLGVAGIATMWDAVFADVGVSVLAILNSVRALKAK